MLNTYQLARMCDTGALLTDGERCYIYSDRSDIAQTAYGWPVLRNGTNGKYQRLPNNLTLAE